MMDVAADNKQWINVIAYQAAENAIGGVRHSETPWETCIAYPARRPRPGPPRRAATTVG